MTTYGWDNAVLGYETVSFGEYRQLVSNIDAAVCESARILEVCYRQLLRVDVGDAVRAYIEHGHALGEQKRHVTAMTNGIEQILKEGHSRYWELVSQLKTMAAGVSSDVQAQLLEQQMALGEYKAKVDVMQQERDTLGAALAESEEQRETCAMELSTVQEKIVEYTATIEGIQQASTACQQARDAMAQELARRQEQMTEYAKKVDAVQEEIGTLRNERDDLASQVVQQRARIVELEQRVGVFVQAEEVLRQTKEQVVAISHEKEVMQQELELKLRGAQEQLAEYAVRIEQLEREQTPKEQAFTIPANVMWTGTGYQVKPDTILDIVATGEIQYDDKGNTCGPEGTGWTDRDKKDPVYTESHGCLLGKIGVDGSPFVVKREKRGRIRQTGELYFGINDAWVTQNTGEFHVTVTVQEG